MATGGRGNRAWRNLSERLRGQLPAVCWICLAEIDRSLHHHDPMSWTLDHVVPISAGGSLLDESNLRPAHRSCNGRKGAGARPIDAAVPRTSRKWA